MAYTFQVGPSFEAESRLKKGKGKFFHMLNWAPQHEHMCGYGGNLRIFLFLSLSLYACECWARVNILIKIQVPLKARISYVNTSFLWRTLLCGFRKWHLLQNLYYIQLPCQDSAKMLGYIYNTTQCHNPDVQRMNSKYVITKRNSHVR
jgi:hypothetical protein